MRRDRTRARRRYDHRGLHVETPRSFYLLVDGQEVHVRGRAPSDPEQLEALRELWRAAFNQVTEKRS